QGSITVTVTVDGVPTGLAATLDTDAPTCAAGEDEAAALACQLVGVQVESTSDLLPDGEANLTVMVALRSGVQVEAGDGGTLIREQVVLGPGFYGPLADGGTLIREEVILG